MKVTIIADASWCPETHAGGYGFWIASGRGKSPGAGAFKSQVDSSMLCEMMALVNALHFGIKNNLLCKGDSVLLQTDCQSAIDLFIIGKSTNSITQSIINKFCNIQNKGELSIELKHVKGHTKGGSARLNCNILCDKHAKDNMRIMRNKLRKVG